ncbi:adenosine deaminase [Actinomadura flavalba]|uniref:adenosine deaminase n=1 Tax=Actinomadura flavalba TaxID=1120938 RepID=UPI000364C34C|nr:adenosine deaminase [Actinomadura flavalba]
MRDLSTLPKAHLHVHLESTVRWTTLREIGDANGVPVPARPASLDGFAGFFEQNSLVRSCLRTYADFHRVAREFCADEAAQGTRYAEVSFTAAAHGERVGDPDLPLAAVLDGLATGFTESGVQTRVILDHSRRRPVERAWATLDLARRHDAVVAIGLAGDEAHPGDPFVPVFAAAREACVHVVHHAGEAAGAESVRQAITSGRAERLGHGIRVLDDPALVAEVRERGLALEVCPSSNVALGFAPSLAEHPLPRLLDAGLTVTVNTDIPAIIDTTLTQEYDHLRTLHGLTDAELATLARNAVNASFAPPATRDRVHTEINTWLT